MVALEIKEIIWLPKRHTKEIAEFQRVGDTGKPLIYKLPR